jgi:hypothetical protein
LFGFYCTKELQFHSRHGKFQKILLSILRAEAFFAIKFPFIIDGIKHLNEDVFQE